MLVHRVAFLLVQFGRVGSGKFIKNRFHCCVLPTDKGESASEFDEESLNMRQQPRLQLPFVKPFFMRQEIDRQEIDCTNFATDRGKFG